MKVTKIQIRVEDVTSMEELISFIFFPNSNTPVSPIMKLIRRFRYSIQELEHLGSDNFSIAFHFKEKNVVDIFYDELEIAMAEALE